jgi:hypothetical protein
VLSASLDKWKQNTGERQTELDLDMVRTIHTVLAEAR